MQLRTAVVVLVQASLPRLGIRRSAWHPLSGDVGQERHERGAGLHDDGGRDQEPGGTAGSVGRNRTGQDRLHAGAGQERIGMLLRGGARRRRTHTYEEEERESTPPHTHKQKKVSPVCCYEFLLLYLHTISFNEWQNQQIFFPTPMSFCLGFYANRGKLRGHVLK